MPVEPESKKIERCAKTIRETAFSDVGLRHVSHLVDIGTPEAIKALILSGLPLRKSVPETEEGRTGSEIAAYIMHVLSDPKLNAKDIVVEHGLSHESPAVKASCISILKAIGDKSVLPHLEKLLKDEDVDVGAVAQRTIDLFEEKPLKSITEYKRLHELKKLLKSSDPKAVRAAKKEIKMIESRKRHQFLQV